eukprot:Colp12_sorted_trinity150504_noHs@7098
MGPSRLRGSVLPVGIFLLALVVSTHAAFFTQAQKDWMLEVHNQMRARAPTKLKSSGTNQPTAANMQKLSWNSQAEQEASVWSDKLASSCGSLVHGGTSGGQNLAMYGAYPDPGLNIYQSVQGWENEKNVYVFGPCGSGCNFGAIGHYTQLVWATTTSVGCGYAKCQSGGMTSYFITCNYYPAGNMNVETTSPYRTGTPCSSCNAGQTCDTTYGPNGLCSSGGPSGPGALPDGPLCGSGSCPPRMTGGGAAATTTAAPVLTSTKPPTMPTTNAPINTGGNNQAGTD